MAFHVWKKALSCTTFHPHWKAFFNPKAPLLAQKHDALRLILYVEGSVLDDKQPLAVWVNIVYATTEPGNVGFLENGARESAPEGVGPILKVAIIMASGVR